MLPDSFSDADVTDFKKLNVTGYDTTAFDYVDKSIYFKIHVNANSLNNATEDITTVVGEKLGDLTVTDKLPLGWEFQKIGSNDFLLYEGKPSVGGAVEAQKAADDANEILSNVISPPTDTEGGKISFTFSSLKKPYLILVKAGPTDETAAKYFDRNTDNTIENSVIISTESTELASDNEDAKIKSELVTKKIDSTKAETDGYLKWSVEYKPYDLAHEGAYLEDILPIGLDLRTDSMGRLIIDGNNIKATELKLNANGTYSEVTGDVPLEGVVSYNSQTRALRFKIPNSQKGYRFDYISDITGSIGNAENKVTLAGGNIPPNAVEANKQYGITAASSDATFRRSGWLLVIKQDATGSPLPGAEFTLFAEDGTTVIRKGISGSDGKIYLKVIPEGDYILKRNSSLPLSSPTNPKAIRIY